MLKKLLKFFKFSKPSIPQNRNAKIAIIICGEVDLHYSNLKKQKKILSAFDLFFGVTKGLGPLVREHYGNSHITETCGTKLANFFNNVKPSEEFIELYQLSEVLLENRDTLLEYDFLLKISAHSILNGNAYFFAEELRDYCLQPDDMSSISPHIFLAEPSIFIKVFSNLKFLPTECFKRQLFDRHQFLKIKISDNKINLRYMISKSYSAPKKRELEIDSNVDFEIQHKEEDLKPIKKIYGVVTCVNYSDTLIYSLESCKKIFEKVFVITDTMDTITPQVCEGFDFVECIQSDCFCKNDAKFNKGAAINQGLRKIPIDKDNWVLIFDADIVFTLQSSYILSTNDFGLNSLYGAVRNSISNIKSYEKFIEKKDHNNACTIFENNLEHTNEVFPHVPDNKKKQIWGYFQLFNSTNLLKENHFYSEEHKTARNVDVKFSNLFKDNTVKCKSMRVLHFGEGSNWCGRLTRSFSPWERKPYFDFPEDAPDKYTTPTNISLNNWSRDLLNEEGFLRFLEKKSIYVSLSTSPKRINKLCYPLNTLDIDNLSSIILCLPYEYRGEEPYEIPDYLLNDPKVLIHRDFKDVGPLSKLTPALRYLKETDPNSILITIDDDTIYPYGMIKEIAYDLYTQLNTVSTASSRDIDFWKAGKENWPPEGWPSQGLVSEGFAGVGYRVSDITESMIDEMEDIASRIKTCKFSDDLVHSYVLCKNGIGVSTINNMYYSKGSIKQLDYGFKEDAIFKGSGLEELSLEIKRGDGVNICKYQHCLEEILK